MVLDTKTLGIKLGRKPNDLEIRGYLLRATSKVTLEMDGKLKVEIEEENIPFILNRITEEVHLKFGICVENANLLKEELMKIGYSEKVNVVFTTEKIEI